MAQANGEINAGLPIPEHIVPTIRLEMKRRGLLQFIENALPAKDDNANNMALYWREYDQRLRAQRYLISKLSSWFTLNDLKAEGWDPAAINPKGTYQKMIRAAMTRVERTPGWVFERYATGAACQRVHTTGSRLACDLQFMKDLMGCYVSAEVPDSDYLAYALWVMANNRDLEDMYRDMRTRHAKGWLTWEMLLGTISEFGVFPSYAQDPEDFEHEDSDDEWN